MSDREKQVVAVLRQIHDPEIPINIHDLGLIYDLSFPAEDAVTVRMTLTAPNCPMADVILAQVRSRLAAIDGVKTVHVDLVWEPKWSPDMMSEAAKLEMEFTGHTGPAHLRKSAKDKFSSLTIDRKPRKP
jgi:FeS assembly SUF system protein